MLKKLMTCGVQSTWSVFFDGDKEKKNIEVEEDEETEEKDKSEEITIDDLYTEKESD